MIWDGPTSSSSKCWVCFGSFPQRQPPLSQAEHAMDLRSPLQWPPCNCDKKQRVGYFGAIQMYPDVSSCRGLNPDVSNCNLIVSRCIQYPSISMNIVWGDHCLLMDHSCSTAWWIKIDWAFSMFFGHINNHGVQDEDLQNKQQSNELWGLWPSCRCYGPKYLFFLWGSPSIMEWSPWP